MATEPTDRGASGNSSHARLGSSTTFRHPRTPLAAAELARVIASWVGGLGATAGAD